MRDDREIEIGPVTVTDIVRFAGAGGDFNPLHHDLAYARAAGHPGIFAMGQLQAGLLSRLVTERFPIQAVRCYRVRFAAKVEPGDVLRLAWQGEESVAVDEETGEKRVTCALAVSNQAGKKVITGSVTAAFDQL